MRSPIRVIPAPHAAAPEQFASGVKKLGVGDGKKVICYDSAGPVLGRALLVDVQGLRP
jgi:3-mercaptopyruvate sulfurtransferase SseA